MLSGCKSENKPATDENNNSSQVENTAVTPPTNTQPEKKAEPKPPSRAELLEAKIHNVVKAFNSRDEQALNNMTSPDLGFWLMCRPGVFDVCRRKDKITFQLSDPDYIRILDFKIVPELKFEAIPTYDCGMEEWTKVGLYCDTSFTDDILSRTATNLKSFQNAQISDSEMDNLKNVDETSLRVVLHDGAEGELVFYLTEYRSRWYLTILDQVSSDCGS